MSNMKLYKNIGLNPFKLHIILSSIILFGAGVAQIYLLSVMFRSEVVANFFLIQAFTVFSIALGGSSITIKTLTQVDYDRPVFNSFPLLHQLAFTVGAMLVIAILPIAQQDSYVWFLAVLICAVNCNAVVIAFLRTNEKVFARVQYYRVLITLARIIILISLSDEASVSQLLSVFILTDFMYTGILFLTMFRGGMNFEFDSGIYKNKAALIWGSLNAALRNLPRMLVFSFVSMFYTPSDLINLRLYLVPREYLVSLMGIVNTAFFKEIFKGNPVILAVALFSLSLVFQAIIFCFLIISDVSLQFSLEAIIFYISAALMYAISQQHWRLIEKNQESVQVVIHILSTCVMGLLFLVTLTSSLEIISVTYLSAFYFTWTSLVLWFSYKKV